MCLVSCLVPSDGGRGGGPQGGQTRAPAAVCHLGQGACASHPAAGPARRVCCRELHFRRFPQPPSCSKSPHLGLMLSGDWLWSSRPPPGHPVSSPASPPHRTLGGMLAQWGPCAGGVTERVCGSRGQGASEPPAGRAQRIVVLVPRAVRGCDKGVAVLACCHSRFLVGFVTNAGLRCITFRSTADACSRCEVVLGDGSGRTSTGGREAPAAGERADHAELPPPSHRAAADRTRVFTRVWSL